MLCGENDAGELSILRVWAGHEFRNFYGNFNKFIQKRCFYYFYLHEPVELSAITLAVLKKVSNEVKNSKKKNEDTVSKTEG